MAYPFEMHFHTDEVSPCGNVPAAEAAAAYRREGYAGVVVTDHYAAYNFARFPGDWNAKVDAYLAGYRAAKAAGEPLGLTVLLGLELRLDGAEKTGEPALDALRDSINEYLVYGVTEEQLRRYPALYTLDEKRLKALAEQLGWFVAQSHPCRSGMKPCPAAYLDGVEVMNGNPRHNSHNEDAASFCRANGLVGLSGSDFHEWEDLAIGGLDFAGPVPDGATLVARLRAGEFVRICAQKGDA